MGNIDIKILEDTLNNQYNDFLLKTHGAFIYHSLKYRELLTRLFPGDTYEYLIAVDGEGSIIGCLPIFYRKGEYGIVANSLPYYGAHGCVLAQNDKVRELLLKRYNTTLIEHNCVASTIIGSPDEDFDLIYKKYISPDYIDERIELMTYFDYNMGQDYKQILMTQYHYKTRNVIRKAEKMGVKVCIDNSLESIEFLYNVHKDNMEAIGGIPKAYCFFETFPQIFETGVDYDVYIATINDKKVAAMLIFYYQGTVEYYTPAIVNEYRSYQPLSLLIFEAMSDAMNKGFVRWNWGGTGVNQTSLYNFKSKWGTTETRYYYYTKIFDANILKLEKEEILNCYHNYYVFPFNQIENKDI